MNDNNIYLGHHLNISHGFLSTVDYANKLGINFFQIFLTSPQMYNCKRKSDSDYYKLKQLLEENKMKVVIHSSYKLNFCNDPDSYIYKTAVKELIDDLNDSVKIGAIGCVLHMGKCKNLDEKTATDNYVKGVKKVLRKSDQNSTLIFETGAGVGSEIYTSIFGLRDLLKRFNQKERSRIKFCIDTCHIFAAGYHIGDKAFVDLFCNLIESCLGWDKIACIHLNDSKNKLNSHKDNHADIGKGNISTKGLKKFIRICFKKNIPVVLETPCETLTKKEQIDLVKGWSK